VTDQQPLEDSNAGVGDTTASLDPEVLARDLDPSAPDPEREDAQALIITRGPGAGSRYRIDRAETRIGRHPEAHILLDDVTVSRRHALLTLVDGQVVLTDQASLNGTYVAGERVDSHVLTDGDEVQIGRFHLLFQEGPDAVQDGTRGA
jgi:pSer/pThr/pTyr-binding forkhead associated (FHA) protein